jgi:hypothetical protein
MNFSSMFEVRIALLHNICIPANIRRSPASTIFSTNSFLSFSKKTQMPGAAAIQLNVIYCRRRYLPAAVSPIPIFLEAFSQRRIKNFQFILSLSIFAATDYLLFFLRSVCLFSQS